MVTLWPAPVTSGVGPGGRSPDIKAPLIIIIIMFALMIMKVVLTLTLSCGGGEVLVEISCPQQLQQILIRIICKQYQWMQRAKEKPIKKNLEVGLHRKLR